MVEVALARTSPAASLDPGFGDDETGRCRLQEADLDLERQRIGGVRRLRHHDMRHRRIDPASDEAALHDAAGMAHVHARAVMDDGAALLAAVNDFFHAQRIGDAVRPALRFVHCPGDSAFERWTGADSAIFSMAMTLSAVANRRYHAGASGLSVTWINQAMIGWVVPPKKAMEVA
jgi:hypothetical protein